MLYFLDAQYNVKGAPNENFAREVMELFTMGVGNYSEKDVREGARAFTGWYFDNLTFKVFNQSGGNAGVLAEINGGEDDWLIFEGDDSDTGHRTSNVVDTGGLEADFIV